MPFYVALLRGIAPTNPKMRGAALKDVFESLGFGGVRTVISSGNVIFEANERSAAKLESAIEVAMHEHLGAPCATIVRSASQIRKLAALPVFEGYDDGPTARCNVTFLKHKPKGSVEIPASTEGAEMLGLHAQAVFFTADSASSQTPKLMALIEKTYGKDVTTRTWKTVYRIVKAFEAR